MQTHELGQEIQSAVTPWSVGLVLICSQCSQEQSYGDSSTSLPIDLKQWLKSRLKVEGTLGKIRVVNTGCLGICPQEKVAIALVPLNNPTEHKCLAIGTAIEKEVLYTQVQQIICPSEDI